MGEKENGPFQLSFNTSLRIDFQGSRVTSDGGLIQAESHLTRRLFGSMVRRIATLAVPTG